MLCVKKMRDMIAKLQDGYKNNAMHVNPKHKWCMKKKKKISQILEKWKNFSFDQSSIDQIPIESGKIKQKILLQFWSVEKQV